MVARSRIAVVGTARWEGDADHVRSLEELQHDVAVAALADASLAFDDIEGIVVGGNDQMDGRAITVMAASGSVGGVDRDILSTPSASEHAFVMGAMRVRSGLYRTQLVMAWSPLETQAIHEVQRLAADPYFHRKLPLDELSAHALQASAIEHEVHGARDIALAVAKKNRRHGGRSPAGFPQPHSLDRTAFRSASGAKLLRWPLTDAVVAPAACALVALVLASEDFIAARALGRPVWVNGMGWATESAFLGDRSLAKADAMVAAREQAYGEADISEPVQQFDFAEVADLTPYQELLAYEGLGLCARGEWHSRVVDGSFAEGGVLPVNPSGGAQSVNAMFAAGLRSIAVASERLRRDENGKLALVQAASGPAMQYQTVVVLGTVRQGVRA